MSELSPPQYLHLQLVPSDWAKLKLAMHPWFIREEWLRGLTPTEIDEFHIKTHWKVLLIGTPGAGMFKHVDGLRSSSWHLHVKGRKKWTICKRDVCTEDVLEPGEVLFYPKDYAHETVCLDNPTITVTDTIRTEENAMALSQRFWHQCVSENKEFDFSSNLCDALQRTLKWSELWRDAALTETVEMRAHPSALGNNYDGRNYITK